MSKKLKAAPLSVLAFAKGLLETNDVDPGYVILQKLKGSRDLLKRWLVAYFSCGHFGASSMLADYAKPSLYWDRLLTYAKGREPRSLSWRHFRGENALKVIASLREFSTPTGFINFAITGKTDTEKNPPNTVVPFDVIKDRVERIHGYGKRISFKAADMLERLGMVNVKFPEQDVMMYDSPAEAAQLVYKTYAPSQGQYYSLETMTDRANWAVNYIRSADGVGNALAPPRFERVVNIQEIETMLCKWKSHLGGRYPVGHDIDEARAELLIYTGESHTARVLYNQVNRLHKELLEWRAANP